MSDYRNYYSHTDLIEIGGTIYLVQGDLQDALTMFRPVDKLLECEKEKVNQILEARK